MTKFSQPLNIREKNAPRKVSLFSSKVNVSLIILEKSKSMEDYNMYQMILQYITDLFRFFRRQCTILHSTSIRFRISNPALRIQII